MYKLNKEKKNSDADYGGGEKGPEIYHGEHISDSWQYNLLEVSKTTLCIKEAEYIALSTTARQQLWLKNALNELHIDIPAAALNRY